MREIALLPDAGASRGRAEELAVLSGKFTELPRVAKVFDAVAELGSLELQPSKSLFTPLWAELAGELKVSFARARERKFAVP